MFEMSFGKLLLLVALVLAVWYGFKYAARIEQVRQAMRAEARRRAGAGAGGGARVQQSARPVEDLVKCRQCGAFVAASGAANCGKPGCPWSA